MNPAPPPTPASSAISAGALIAQLRWRYSVKKFDASRVLPATTWAAIEDATILSPSSYGLQAWRMGVITDPAIKARLPGISWNQQQPRDCSHMVVFASRVAIGMSDVDAAIHRMAQVRQQPPTHPDLAAYRDSIVGSIRSMTTAEADEWCARQCFIALGFMLSACAMLGVDACPLEGIDCAAYDTVIGMPGYRTVIGAALGYRDPDDWLAPLPKVRFEPRDIVRYV